ncbi:MAG: hypothetical protein KGI08_09725 [Thaumarchaeota archaeon]|nr:hypothetical protein [Nitrososphaerota archaeon]
MMDFTNAKWGLCKYCSHQIAEITEITEYAPQGKATRKRKWLHTVPVVGQQRCTFKGCNCGGNGFEIYGRYFENKTCGICGKGIICLCVNPEPQMMEVIPNG